MNITQLFFEAAQKYPQKKAIIEPGANISFEDLASKVRQTAAYFKSKGLKQGDRVLVFIPMSIDLYRIVLALFYIGATAVFMDQWASWKRLKIACRLADCRGFIGSSKSRLLGLFIADIRRIPLKLKPRKMADALSEQQKVDSEHPALITFTTGSTGIPKAAIRSHGILKHQFEALIDEVEINAEAVDMPVLPIVLFLNLGVGSTSVIANFNPRKVESLKPDIIWQQVQEHQVNRITASPYFVKTLALHLKDHKGELGSLQKIVTGGAPVFPAEAQIYTSAFPETDIQIVYGSTEAEPISSIKAHELVNHHFELNPGLAVGALYEGLELRIIKLEKPQSNKLSQKEFAALSLADCNLGEIVVSGQHVVEAYFRNEQAFQENKVVVDGKIWHRTGDSGIMRNGKLFLTGRCQELISVEGRYLSGFIIENQLQQIPGIMMGTLLKLEAKSYLIVETELSLADLKDQLPSLPYDQLLRLKKIPRDPRHNSKIDYGALKDQIRLLKKP
jgi:acyl-CoA synthetase (AMP-forming)/AMP-acid ligase II